MMNPLSFDQEVERVISRYAHRADRQDLRQECYVALLEAGEEIAQAMNPYAKAYVVCRNRVIDVLRSEVRNELSLSDPRVAAEIERRSECGPPDDRLIDLRDALGRLTSEEVKIVGMYYGLSGPPMTHGQIAEALGKSEDWVRRRLILILKRLAGLLGATNASDCE